MDIKVNDLFMELYTRASQWAQRRNETVGENNEYYITLEELERLITQIELEQSSSLKTS